MEDNIFDKVHEVDLKKTMETSYIDHGVKNSSLYRFQSVSYIWKRTGSNNTHGIIDIGGLHRFL